MLNPAGTYIWEAHDVGAQVPSPITGVRSRDHLLQDAALCRVWQLALACQWRELAQMALRCHRSHLQQQHSALNVCLISLVN